MITIKDSGLTGAGMPLFEEPARFLGYVGAIALSYSACAVALHAAFPLDPAAQAEFDALVPPGLFAAQAAAFGGVLLLTLFNTASVRRSAVHVRGNVMLLLIHAVAMATDAAVATHWSAVVRGGDDASDARAARWLPWAAQGGGGAAPLQAAAAACVPNDDDGGTCAAAASAMMAAATPPAAALPPLFFHPQRYVQWTHTTPTMLLMMSLASDLPSRDLLWIVTADIVMMVAGGLASWCGRTLPGLAWGTASFVAFMPVLVGIRRMLLSAEREAAGGDEEVAAGALRVLRRLAVATWLAFPGVWLLTYAGVIGPLAEQSAWAACDFGAKALFSSHLWQANLLSVQQRRAAARERFETAARALAADRLRALLAERGWLVESLTCDLRGNVNGLLALLAQLSACEAAAPPPGAAAAAVAQAAAAAAAAENGSKGGRSAGAGRQKKQQQKYRPKQLTAGGGGGAEKEEDQEEEGDDDERAAANAAGGSDGGTTAAEGDDDASASAAVAAAHGQVVAVAAAAAAADSESRERRLRLIATLRSSAGMLLNAINTTLDSAAAQTGALRLEKRAVPLWRSAEGVARLTRPLLADGVALVNAIPGGDEVANAAAAPPAGAGASGPPPPAPPHEAWARWRRSPAAAPPASPAAAGGGNDPPAAAAASSPPPLEVLADPTRLIQALFTLTGTAARWTPAGGRIALSAEVLPGGREVRVTVADTGVGIPRERFDAVFGSSEGSAGGGSDGGGSGGFGPSSGGNNGGADGDRGGANALLLVRNCLAAMGSTLVVRSAEGRGTRASFVLPLAPPPGGFLSDAEGAAAAKKQQIEGAAGAVCRRANANGHAAPAAAAAADGNGEASQSTDAQAPGDLQALWATVQELRDEVASLKKRQQ